MEPVRRRARWIVGGLLAALAAGVSPVATQESHPEGPILRAALHHRLKQLRPDVASRPTVFLLEPVSYTVDFTHPLPGGARTDRDAPARSVGDVEGVLPANVRPCSLRHRPECPPPGSLILAASRPTFQGTRARLIVRMQWAPEGRTVGGDYALELEKAGGRWRVVDEEMYSIH